MKMFYRMVGFKVALSFTSNKFPTKKYFKEFLKHTYIMINASNEGICVEFWRKKQHNLDLPTFKLPTSTNNLLRLTW